MKQALQDQNPNSQNRKRERDFRKPRNQKNERESEDSYRPGNNDERAIKGTGEYILNFNDEAVQEFKPQRMVEKPTVAREPVR